MPIPDRDYNLEEVLQAFRRDGSLIREKARVLTEEGLEHLYGRMQQGELSTTAFLDIMKYLAEIGDLKPKTSQNPSNTGPKFSITINIPQKDGNPPITLEAIPVETETGEVGVVGLGDVPIHQLGKPYDNSDLEGSTDD